MPLKGMNEEIEIERLVGEEEERKKQGRGGIDGGERKWVGGWRKRKKVI